ncbi:mitochondrial sodium/calcium exchanger protein-like isoform X2 [Ornithodoros turicata]|uniref:mitochondrial sodium/calcium exchanger protein-like isoform X2 n=1 Tax=Ornithodoros turicata TaxID=34597 RepID=UPI003138BE47
MVPTDPLQLMATPCRDVTNWNLTDKCEFVRMVPSCQPNMGYVNYLELMYCMLGPENVTYTVGLSVVWLLLLFVALGVTSGDFLTPALFVISKTLRMSQNVAGVTLLAFGNGSPDIFSSLAGIKQGSYEMVIGGLIGGGIFVTTVVAGSIFLTQPFKMAGRPFLRDCFFYTTAASWTFYSFYMGSISLTTAVGFICLYSAYIVLVVVSGFVYQRFLNNQKKDDNEKRTDCKAEKLEKGESVVAVKRVFKKRLLFDDPERSYVVPLAFRYLNVEDNPTPAQELNNNNEADPEEGVYYINLGMDSREEEVDVDTLAITVDSPRRGSNLEKLHLQKIEKKSSSVSEIVLLALGLDDWFQQPISIRLMCIFKSPIYFILAITTPVVDVVKPKNNWCRPLNSLHCVTAPVFASLASGYGLEMINGVVPVFVPLAAVGAFFGLVVFFTTTNDVPPRYHWAFSYVGFLVGVVWIYVISMEIVVLLQAVGMVFNISDAILGLTILAWGNGLLDFLANLNIARKGFPRMGIAACFGTPCLTLLLGVGIPTLIQLAGTGNVLVLHYSKIITVLFSSLAVSLLSSAITNVVLRFNTKRFYGVYLLALYFTFLVVAVLVESDFL